jgi:hypothetical protein
LARIPLGGIRLRVSRPIKYLQHSSKPITGGGKGFGEAIVRKKGGEVRKYPEQELVESRCSGLKVDFKRNGAPCTKHQNMYYQKLNCRTSLPSSAFMCLARRYIIDERRYENLFLELIC